MRGCAIYLSISIDINFLQIIIFIFSAIYFFLANIVEKDIKSANLYEINLNCIYLISIGAFLSNQSLFATKSELSGIQSLKALFSSLNKFKE